MKPGVSEENMKMTAKRILVSVDKSTTAAQILPHLSNFFSPSEYEIILLRVVRKAHGLTPEPPQQVIAEYREPAYRSERESSRAKHPIYDDQARDSLRAEIEREMQKIMRTLRETGYEVSLIVKFRDNIAGAILDCVKEQNPDLIAMAPYGQRRLNRLLFGDVAEKVQHKVSIPVLLMHPAQKRASGGEQ
jgi:nucleotide-binding universal stress UspA family protein